jgi:Tol biopolymer transport system component
MRFARTRTALTLFVVATITATGIGAQQGTPADALLGQALHLEEVESNFAGAIEIYKKVAADPKAPRTTVARSLLQLGGCYERLGQQVEARAAFERVVKNYADSGVVLAVARERLAAMQAGAAGPSERVITTDRTLGGIGVQRWSPDGRMVIGIRLGGSEFDGSGLYLRNVETAAGRVLFSRAPGYFPGAWEFSPDGRRFAALMPQVVPQSVIADALRSGAGTATITSPGVLIVGGVDAADQPRVLEIPAMATVNPFANPSRPLAWSPDGRWLALAMPDSPVRTYEIHIMNAATGELRPLGLRAQSAVELHWSPSGRELLIHAPGGAKGVGALHVIAVASSERRSLPLPGEEGARVRVLRWGTGGEIAVGSANAATPQVEDIYLINDVDGRHRKVCAGQAADSWSGGHPNASADLCREVTSDGRRQLVWLHASKRLVIRDLSSGVDRPLTSGAGGEEYFGRLSPDDRLVVFLSNRDGRWGLFSAEIARAPVSRPSRLSVFEEMPTSFARATWTSDGFIASVSRNVSNIVKVNVDPASGKATGDQFEHLTQDGNLNHTPAISPHGQKVVYWTRHNTRFGIGVMDSNGSNERLVFDAGHEYGGLQPTWRSASEVVFTVPVAGASPAQLYNQPWGTPLSRTLMSFNTTTGVAGSIAEIPDIPRIGGRIQYLAATQDVMYLDSDFRTLKARSLVNGLTRVVATFPGETEVESFLASPDGRRIAYALARRYESGRACFSKGSSPVATVDQIAVPCEIAELTLDTGERKVMATMPGQGANVPALLAWSPDGRFLLYGGGRPQVLDTTNGDRWPLLPPGVPLNWDRTASWSPDGTFIVLTNRSEHFEWRQWTGVR